MLDFGRGGFSCGGGWGYGVTMLMVEAVGISGGGHSNIFEAVEKARETGCIGMIIGDILCLFLLQKLPILIDPFTSPPCMV